MDKFYKEFYASRLEDWKNKYIKLLELRKLVKLIVNDIEKHGGKIERNNGRITILDDARASIQLDRRSVGLSALGDKENLFNKNTPIFDSPIMYEIETTFKEIETLSYSDDIKIFLYFLQIEIHNVYVFYLNIEKEIFTRTNEHLYKRKNIEKMDENEVLQELNDLTEIAYLTYSFYLYADLNVEAVHQILIYFDEHFMPVNDNTSLNELYFKKYLSQNESDLKYILSYKIVIESTALLESYRKELIELYPNNSDIKTQAKELNDVLRYLVSKDTDRVNDDIYEIYINSDRKTGGIIKQKRNVDVDIRNSFFIDIHKADDYLKTLEELQYDKKMRIHMTCRNKINICILFFYVLINSIYYIIPYSSLYFYYKEKQNERNGNSEKTVNFNFEIIEYLGIILCSTHIGLIFSRLISSCFSRFKAAYFFYCICFFFSFSFIVSSPFINFGDSKINFYIKINIIIISRFFFGLSNERIITRKYLILFLPESKMKIFSVFFLIISYLGLISGACIPCFMDLFPKVLNIYDEEYFIYIVGLMISFLYLFIILLLFTEPNKNDEGNMLTQKILNLSQVTDEFDIESYKNKKKKDERFKVKENLKSSDSDYSINNSDDLMYQENNKEIKIESSDIDDESIKLIKDKVISKKELQGLNSIEEDIIKMNKNQNFDDVNLLGNELERIRRNETSNNKVFTKSFIVFALTLFLCHMINEYILIKTPFILEEFLGEFFENKKKWLVTPSFIILLIFSFPILVFCRIIKKFDIGRRLLLISYLLIFFSLVGIGLYKYYIQDMKIQKMPFLSIIFVTFLLSNLLEGITHLLIEKIIPSFAKFGRKNMKYIFSYMIHIGKAFGGINFFLFKKLEKKVDYIESIFFVSMTFIFFIISLICYKSLRVRAFAKLRFSQDLNK